MLYLNNINYVVSYNKDIRLGLIKKLNLFYIQLLQLLHLLNLGCSPKYSKIYFLRHLEVVQYSIILFNLIYSVYGFEKFEFFLIK